MAFKNDDDLHPFGVSGNLDGFPSWSLTRFQLLQHDQQVFSSLLGWTGGLNRNVEIDRLKPRIHSVDADVGGGFLSPKSERGSTLLARVPKIFSKVSADLVEFRAVDSTTLVIGARVAPRIVSVQTTHRRF